MGYDLKKFDVQKFLWIFGVFGAVAALLFFTKPQDEGNTNPRPFPLYDLHLTASNAKGSIILNGISIGHHQSNKTTRASVISLTPWLRNGQNSLYLTTGKPNSNHQPSLRADLQITPINGQQQIAQILHLKKASSKKYIITANGLPKWQWVRAEARFHDTQEIKTAVKNLYRAFKTKDLKTIKQVEAPLFKDMEILTGREGLQRRLYREEIITKGQVAPLAPIIIAPFDNGRIMRVTNKDGEAPIRVYFRYGNGGKVILTGQFWSKINGQWHVVR